MNEEVWRYGQIIEDHEKDQQVTKTDTLLLLHFYFQFLQIIDRQQYKS